MTNASRLVMVAIDSLLLSHLTPSVSTAPENGDSGNNTDSVDCDVDAFVHCFLFEFKCGDEWSCCLVPTGFSRFSECSDINEFVMLATLVSVCFCKVSWSRIAFYGYEINGVPLYSVQVS